MTGAFPSRSLPPSRTRSALNATMPVTFPKAVDRHTPAGYPPLIAVRMKTSEPGAKRVSKPARLPSTKIFM